MSENQSSQTPPTLPTKNDLSAQNIPSLLANKKKLIFLLLGLIFFLLATSAITIRKSQTQPSSFTSQLNVTPTPRPYNTSTQDNIPKNWKMYNNDFYNISFRYPPEFSPQTFRRLQDPNKLFVLIRLNNNFEYPVMDLSVVTSDLNIEEWIENKNYCPSSFKSCTSFILTPIPSSIQFESINRHYTSINTFFKNGAYIFDFSLGAKKPNTPFSNNERGLYNQILSTFKFLQPTDKTLQSGLSPIKEILSGKTLFYTPSARFSVILDNNKHPLDELSCTPTGIISYVSNLSVNGPDNYPIGFEAIKEGSCTLTNRDFFVTILVQE